MSIFAMSCFNINLQQGSSLKRVPLINCLLYNKVISVFKKKWIILKLARYPSTYEIFCLFEASEIFAGES